ncbi:uncharacterized protein LOC118465816 isoform X2 [Anopheles albimanus]|uniref:uncharacterized protein LOC118465816 isoform X2 n=1 Tax=Anopheles albimanus TaxID=7167 RepID=UPI001640FDBB|nr:uncharacterized protein LOC118465816 isoform X2 [Anopheles albimanus]
MRHKVARDGIKLCSREEDQIKTFKKELIKKKEEKMKKEKMRKTKKVQNEKNQNEKNENDQKENETILIEKIQAEMVKKMIKKVMDTVSKSVRYYDNLRLIVLPYMIPEFLPLWNSIYPKVSQHIYSLELDFKQVPDQSLAALLAPTIELMPHLRSLSIWSLSGPPSYIDIRHSSVQHLSLHCTNCIAVDMPQLESYEGPMDALRKPYPSSQPLVLLKLKHVALTVGSGKLDGPSIIRRLAQVETMKVMFRLRADLFYVICEACSELKQLYFRHLCVTDQGTTSQLSWLVNLRQLTFHSISIEEQWFLTLNYHGYQLP